MFISKMKKAVAASLISGLMIAAVPVFAQKADPDAMAKKLTDRMNKELTLSGDQYQKVNTIHLDYAKAAAELKNSSNTDRAVQHTEIKKLKEKRDAALKGVLTSEQYQSYLQHKEERHDKKKAGKKKES